MENNDIFHGYMNIIFHLKIYHIFLMTLQTQISGACYNCLIQLDLTCDPHFIFSKGRKFKVHVLFTLRTQFLLQGIWANSVHVFLNAMKVFQKQVTLRLGQSMLGSLDHSVRVNTSEVQKQKSICFSYFGGILLNMNNRPLNDTIMM